MRSPLTVCLAVSLLSQVALGQMPRGARPLTLKEEAAKYGGSIRRMHNGDGLPEPMEKVLQRADVIIIGNVTDFSSRLSDYVVLTDYKVQVRKIIKDKTGTLELGKELTFTKIGGVVTDSISRIEYIDPETPLLVKSQTYLLIGVHSGGLLKIHTPAQFRIMWGKARCESRRPEGFLRFCDSDVQAVISSLAQIVDPNKNPAPSSTGFANR